MDGVPCLKAMACLWTESKRSPQPLHNALSPLCRPPQLLRIAPQCCDCLATLAATDLPLPAAPGEMHHQHMALRRKSGAGEVSRSNSGCSTDVPVSRPFVSHCGCTHRYFTSRGALPVFPTLSLPGMSTPEMKTATAKGGCRGVDRLAPTGSPWCLEHRCRTLANLVLDLVWTSHDVSSVGQALHEAPRHVQFHIEPERMPCRGACDVHAGLSARSELLQRPVRLHRPEHLENPQIDLILAPSEATQRRQPVSCDIDRLCLPLP